MSRMLLVENLRRYEVSAEVLQSRFKIAEKLFVRSVEIGSGRASTLFGSDRARCVGLDPRPQQQRQPRNTTLLRNDRFSFQERCREVILSPVSA